VIELLAITEGAAPLPSPLHAVRSGGLSAICAPAPGGARTSDDLWQREALLERLMEDRDVLPVRFGTVVRDEAAVRAAVAAREEELAAGLDRVRGAVELALRVEARALCRDAGHGDGTGRGYLSAKAASARTAHSLHEPLAALARASALRPGRELLRAAYLVDRGAVDAFVALVRHLQGAHEEELALVCTGPWPPFSFAEEVPRG
jgi:hypothetical protein